MSYGLFDINNPTAEDLKNARRFARLSQEDAAIMCGLHRTNYQRQERGISRVNVAAFRLLLMLGGWLPEPFDGWRIFRGALHSPEGYHFEPGELYALPFKMQLLSEFARQLRGFGVDVNPYTGEPFGRTTKKLQIMEAS